jgi:hypothetical protein
MAMDWILLAGLITAGVLLLVAMMVLLRVDRRTRRLPAWIPSIGIVVAGSLFAVSIVSGSWLNAVLFGLNLLTFSMLLGVTRRPAR